MIIIHALIHYYYALLLSMCENFYTQEYACASLKIISKDQWF